MYSPGTIIGEKYRLEEQIGEGGMAIVWRAMHTTLERPVAIKFVYLEGHDVDSRRERFLREAQLAASIRHRCIVDIIDFGHTDDGQPYMIMELLEGETLGERFDRKPTLTTDETVRIFDMLMGGLAAIHDKGIVHRDLKPENIFLTQDEEGMLPKLTDFGISRIASRASQRPPGIRQKRAITTPGLLLGTPDYFSPEQAKGLPSVDLRSDVFSAGVLLYEALSGTLPFADLTLAGMIGKIIRDAPTPLTEFGIDPALSAVVELAMAKDPAQRPQNARQLRVAMRAATRLTLADLNDSQVVSGTALANLVPLLIAPAASLPPMMPESPAVSSGARVLPARAAFPEQRQHSSTSDTLSGSPAPRPKWLLWLGLFALVAVIAIVAAFVST
ncbi:MAG: serine/threonine protein kinase [Deltaproteobacteria bacterium]|nr:serine/threonine protein kinase [Deltaproteobacteria bacterium]